MSIKKKKLNTMCGQIGCSDSFIWDAHIHLWGQPYHSADDPDLILKNEAMSVEEMHRFYDAGGRVVVEFSPYDFGRDWRVLRRISEETKVHILGGCGFYRSAGLEPVLAKRSEKEWIDFMVRECTQGEAYTGAKPSFLKWSTSLMEITEAEKTSLRIIAEVHGMTGLPVVTHTQRGTMVTEQLNLLRSAGIDFSRLLISHIDMRENLCPDMFEEVLCTGAYVSVDQLGKPKYGSEDRKIEVILELCQKGYEKQILLATDIGRRSNFKVTGGSPGIEHIPSAVIPMLMEHGAPSSLIHQLVTINPTNFYGVDSQEGNEPEASRPDWYIPCGENKGGS